MATLSARFASAADTDDMAALLHEMRGEVHMVADFAASVSVQELCDLAKQWRDTHPGGWARNVAAEFGGLLTDLREANERSNEAAAAAGTGSGAGAGTAAPAGVGTGAGAGAGTAPPEPATAAVVVAPPPVPVAAPAAGGAGGAAGAAAPATDYEKKPVAPPAAPTTSAMTVASSGGSGGAKLYPLWGVTLGKTTLKEMQALGGVRDDEYTLYSLTVPQKVNTANKVNFWFHKDTPVIDHTYWTKAYSGEDTMPKPWSESLGFSSVLSFMDWRNLLADTLGDGDMSKVYITKGPANDGGLSKKRSSSLGATLECISMHDDPPVLITLSFSYGPRGVDSKCTLYSVRTKVADAVTIRNVKAAAKSNAAAHNEKSWPRSEKADIEAGEAAAQKMKPRNVNVGKHKRRMRKEQPAHRPAPTTKNFPQKKKKDAGCTVM